MNSGRTMAYLWAFVMRNLLRNPVKWTHQPCCKTCWFHELSKTASSVLRDTFRNARCRVCNLQGHYDKRRPKKSKAKKRKKEDTNNQNLKVVSAFFSILCQDCYLNRET